MNEQNHAVGDFFSNYDLLYCLGNHIRSQKLFYDLCLVNKTLNHVFTKFLYRKAVIWPRPVTISESDNRWAPIRISMQQTERDHDPGALFPSKGSRWHALRELTVRDLFACIPQETICSVQDIQKEAQDFIEQCPLLTRLNWRYSPLLPQTLEKLRLSCPELRQLRLERLEFLYSAWPMELVPASQFAWDHEIAIVHDARSAVFNSLGSFSNLTSLRLYDILGPWAGNMANERQILVQILAASPGLEEFGISLCWSDGQGQTWQAQTSLERQQSQWDKAHFLYDLCHEYADTGSAPLKLRLLDLGAHICLYGEGDRSVLDMIANWTITASELHTWETQQPAPALYLGKLCDLSVLEEVHLSQLRGIHAREANNRYLVPALSTFSEDLTPRLQRLVFPLYDGPFSQWLIGLRDTSLAGQVAAIYESYDHDKTPEDLWGSKTMEVFLKGGAYPARFAIIHPDVGISEPRDVHRYCRHLLGAAGSIEALWIRSAERIRDVFPGRLISPLLKGLTILRALRIHASLLDLNLEASVRQLAELSSSLRYVMVEGKDIQRAWSIWRGEESRVYRLVPMDAWERDEVELFRYWSSPDAKSGHPTDEQIGVLVRSRPDALDLAGLSDEEMNSAENTWISWGDCE